MGIKRDVKHFVATINIPEEVLNSPSNLTDIVFLTIENSPDLMAEYQRLCGTASSRRVVDSFIPQVICRRFRLVVEKDENNRRVMEKQPQSTLIQSYSRLQRR